MGAIGEVVTRITGKNGKGKGKEKGKGKSRTKNRKPLSEIIKEWFIRQGWRLSESRRVVHRNIPLHGMKDEPIDIKVFINVENGSAWCRYYGPDYRKEELKKLREQR